MNIQNEMVFYTGTQTSDTENGIFRCSLNQLNGSMRIVSSIAGIENSSYLTLNSAGDRLYAVSEKSEGEVFVYAIDKETGELHLLDRKPTQGADPCYISLSVDGQYVFVSNYSGGNVNVFRIGDNGTLSEQSCMVTHSGQGMHSERQEAAHPHSVFSDPSGDFVMVCDLGMDQIVIYRLDEGRLVTHREVELPAGSGPRHFEFHPTHKWAYGLNELSNDITVFAYDDKSSDLQILQSISTLPDDYNGENTAADIHVSLCGRFLYASNRGNDSIVLYSIDMNTGHLTAVEWITTHGICPRNFTIVDGGYLLVANQESGNIISFFMDPETGRLTGTGFLLEIPRPMCIQSIAHSED